MMLFDDELTEVTTSKGGATQGRVGVVMSDSWASFHLRIGEERAIEIEHFLTFITKHLDCCFLYEALFESRVLKFEICSRCLCLKFDLSHVS